MFPLHVVDVPGDALHRVYRVQHHVVALCVLVEVIFYFLKDKQTSNSLLFKASYFVNDTNGTSMISSSYFIFAYLFTCDIILYDFEITYQKYLQQNGKTGKKMELGRQKWIKMS